MDSESSPQVERLRSSFSQFRERAGTIVAKIQAQFPSLTLHDISHLDALWETSSLIAGEKWNINPLEGFVLGGAILLHDAALCFEAYNSGQEGLRSTDIWKDSYALALDNYAGDIDRALADADFVAIRHLHASQAEMLLERSWPDPDTGEPMYLLDDLHIRKHLGRLIGRIAASHHLSLDEIEGSFKKQLNAPGEFPREWAIDPLKLACLLRCADALHIDHRRAPDFLHALLKRQGVSLAHWKAQNWLSRADYDHKDPAGCSIVITSTRSFPEKDSEAWWVAFDAVSIAHQEICSSNKLLLSNSCQEFQVNKIAGAQSPSEMAEYIETEGWEPCSAAIHVSNVEKLVRTLGGEQLYSNGDKLGVVLRELIQNSRDAIKARELVEPGFKGCIKINLISSREIIIDDNGVGMSQRTLLGPFLDFGTSFWATSLLHAEFPGLKSSKFKPVGRFGIGFYSVFMAADEVRVQTRRWDAALSETCQLQFPNGLVLRPTLRVGRFDGVNSSVSTRISLRLKEDAFNPDGNVLVKGGFVNVADFKVSILDCIKGLVAGLDTDVSVYLGGVSFAFHAAQPIDEGARREWLTDFSFSKFRNDPDIESYISAHAHRLRPLVSDGKCVGLAALATKRSRGARLSLSTVGGMAAGLHTHGGSHYIGFMDHSPKSAKRDADKLIASEGEIKAWVEEQLSLLGAMNLTLEDEIMVPYSLASFGVDPSRFGKTAFVFPDGKIGALSIKEAAGLLRKMPIGFYKSKSFNFVDSYAGAKPRPNMIMYFPYENGPLNSLEFNNGEPKELSLVWALSNAAREIGIKVSWETQASVDTSMMGAVDVLVMSGRME